MDKVLVVEDDKVLSKVIEKKIRATHFIPIMAPSKESAANWIEKESFFAAILDLHLPDASNGEIVDFVLSKKIPSIVLTSTYDNDVRIETTKKPIVDYVIKNREESIDYAVKTLSRIKKYSKMKALIVEDSTPQRAFMKKLLDALQFQTFEAQDGLGALEIVKEHPDMKLVITDYFMPNMDGFELMLKLRRDHKEDSMVIIALTAHDSNEVSSKFLKFGASDYLTKPFTKEEFNYRINKKMDLLDMMEEIRDYSEKLEIASESIRHANSAKLKYIQTIEEYLDIIDRHVYISKTDLEGTITYASNALLRLVGHEWSSFVGQNHRVLRHPDMPDKIFKQMWQTITRGETWSGEIKNKKKNGDIVWMQTTISPVFDDGKKHVGYVSFSIDTTDKVIAQKLVVTDPLTKTFNRMKLDTTLEGELTRIRRYKLPLSIIMFDIDHFKAINDEHGHLIGDQALIHLAKLVKARIRTMDVFGRWSGEEFMIICPNTNLDGAQILSNRILDDIRKETFPGGIKITCSFGLSESEPEDDKHEFIRRTIGIVNKAKENGRDRLEVHVPPKA